MDLTPKEMQAQYAKALDKIAEMADHVSVLEAERDAATARLTIAEAVSAGLHIHLEAKENARLAAVARTEKAEALLAEATAFSLEPGENSDVWWAFECFHCFHEFGSSGLVFDARLPVSVELPTAKCPRCGTECEFKQSWGATQSGHGARGDGGLVTRVQELEAQVKRQDAALGRRAKALKTLKDLPAIQESILATTIAPTVDHGAALLEWLERSAMEQLGCEALHGLPHDQEYDEAVGHAEALIAEHNAALAREAALRKPNNLPAFTETILATTIVPTVDHGAALLDALAVAECHLRGNEWPEVPQSIIDAHRHAEALIEDLNTERNWRPYYETELQPLFKAFKRLGAPDEPDTELHHQIEWLVERLDKTEKQRNRARAKLEALGYGLTEWCADEPLDRDAVTAALADEPDQT